ncbi:WhiB family transcriptional regulator [Streptomyces sp. NPDC056707]|uniref:WhiB family transcriptional regulator n=1 Tax=Streptomyces sp. NPDC056707 TaxID=3345919 RepID=UPI003675B6EF
MTDIDWTQALCLGADREKWFVEGTTADANADRAEAKKTCFRCPIREDCLTSALAEEQGRGESGRFGIRGGKSSKQRYEMTRRRVGAQSKQQRVA